MGKPDRLDRAGAATATVIVRVYTTVVVLSIMGAAGIAIVGWTELSKSRQDGLALIGVGGGVFVAAVVLHVWLSWIFAPPTTRRTDAVACQKCNYGPLYDADRACPRCGASVPESGAVVTQHGDSVSVAPAVKIPDPPSPHAVDSDGEPFCRGCGTAFEQGDRYCGQCARPRRGVAVSPREKS